MQLKMKISEWKNLKDGEPCKHPGCLSHITHPCEECGRIGGINVMLIIHKLKCELDIANAVISDTKSKLNSILSSATEVDDLGSTLYDINEVVLDL